MSQFLGKLLVASPLLDQTPFSRSVVFVFQDNEDATVGVILNQPADDQVKQAWSSIVGKSAESSLVSIGGPIAGPVVVIHRDRQAAEIELPTGLYTAASEDNIQYLANRSERPVHVFLACPVGKQANWPTRWSEVPGWLCQPIKSCCFAIRMICRARFYKATKSISSRRSSVSAGLPPT